MPRLRRLTTLSLTAAAVVAAVPAIAATPESGTISNASPRIDWEGENVNGGLTTLPAFSNGGTVAGCNQPSCDTFALKVADPGDLTVTASSPNERVFVMVEIVKPDGSTVYSGGSETESSTTVKIKKAPAGDYEVRIANNAIEIEPYVAFATLPAAPAPAPGPAPQPQPQPQPQPGQGQPPASPSATVSVVTKKLSARKTRKKAKLAISSSGPVQNVVVTLRKGKKVLGTGKLAQLNGRANVGLKLKKKLKKGRYTVGIAAKDNGRPIGASAPLTVKK